MKKTLGQALKEFERDVEKLDEGSLSIMGVRQEGGINFCVIGQMDSGKPQIVFLREDMIRETCDKMLEAIESL